MQTKKILSLAILISLVFCCSPSLCRGQKKKPAADYDYYALATSSITEIARDASKLPDIPQRLRILIDAAKILAPANQPEAVRLLDVALADLKEWGSSDNTSWRQRNIAATLRNEVLALYMLIDSEKALVRDKEFQSSGESSVNNTPKALNFKSESWRTQFNDQRTAADQPAKVALSLIDSDPEKALGLVVQSVQGGIVSSVLFDIQEKLIKNGNRALVDRLENRIGQVLRTSVALDPSSPDYAAILGLADRDMPQSAKNSFVSFLMRSLQAWVIVAKEPGVDSFYITRGFTTFSGSPRVLISQYAPDQLLEFDLLLDQTAPLVPEKTRARIQGFQPEPSSDPKDRLADILKDPVADRRDLRLIRLVSELLKNESEDSQKSSDLAAEAVSGFSDEDVKSAYTDRLTIARVNAFVKQKKIIEAQQLTGSISSQEARAWALLAVASVAAKEDKVLGFESITKALKALDGSSPTPYKAELALLATAMLVKNDPRRAFETLLAAVKYANSSESKHSARTKPPVGFGLEARIGESQTRLGVVPSSLSDIRIEPSLSGLAVTDWFRADQIVSTVREPSLRLVLRLQFAGAVLAKELKSKQSQPVPKSSVNN